MNKYVSGIRPSGKLHLGNYLGALQHWKKLHDAGEQTYFFVADMHGQYDIGDIVKTVNCIADMKIPIYLQGDKKRDLLELQHELSFYANTSRLDNMTQYKEKGGTLALYAYPVLMAADILYHEATHVPIGDDQKQHLELVRELARKTGRKEPEAIVHRVGSRIMGLKDATKKMSKSDPDPDQCIYLCDSADEIRRKIKGATTSTNFGDRTPAADNLREIYSALGESWIGVHSQWGEFKRDLTDLLIEKLKPNS